MQALSKAVIENTKNFDTAFLAMELQKIALQYLASERVAKVKKRYFTDKMPVNYRYLFLALSCLPSAKVLWCRRDRMPLKWSIYKSLFATQGNPFAYNFNKIDVEIESQELLMNLTKKHFPDQVIEIRYQDLVECPKDVINWMLDRLALPYNDKCLDFHKNERPVNTRSFHQVRQKIFSGSDSAWLKFEKKLSELGVI